MLMQDKETRVLQTLMNIVKLLHD